MNRFKVGQTVLIPKGTQLYFCNGDIMDKNYIINKEVIGIIEEIDNTNFNPYHVQIKSRIVMEFITNKDRWWFREQDLYFPNKLGILLYE